MATKFDSIVTTITKPPALRTDAELEMMLPWLRKNTSLFANLARGVLLDLIRNCEYHRVPRDYVIIRQGDIGECFYVMLTGSSSVYIDAFLTGEMDAVSSLADDKDTTQSEDCPPEEKRSSISENKPKRLDRSQFGNFIFQFGAGKSFGELALMNPDSVRNASIVADEDCDLLVINRELFNRSLKARQEQEYAERRAFIASQPLFETWNAKYKRLLEMSIRKQTLGFGDVIVQQGKPVIGLHFIVKGQAKVCVQPEMHRRQYPRFYDGTDSSSASGQESEHASMPYPEIGSREALLQPHIRVRRRGGYNAAENRQRNKSVEICLVDRDEILGDAETVLEMSTYHHTVICNTRTECFILDNKNIERLVRRRGSNAMELLRQEVEQKLLSRNAHEGLYLFRRMIHKIQSLSPKVLDRESHKVHDDDDKSDAMRKLVDLFLKNKAPLIMPAVPGSLYYLTQAMEKKRQRMQAQQMKRPSVPQQDVGNRVSVSNERRVSRVRRPSVRRPRSRRELQRTSICQPVAYLADLNGHKHGLLSAGDSPLPGADDYHGGGRGSVASIGESSGHVNSVFMTQPPEEMLRSNSLTIPGVLGDMSNVTEYEQTGHRVLRPSTTVGYARPRQVSTVTKTLARFRQVMRPQTAPMAYGGMEDQREQGDSTVEEDVFDWDTGNRALSQLESKIRSFHADYDRRTKKVAVAITPMRRFVVEGPSDIPMPGGTVYVRQRPCQHAGIRNRHQVEHVRRFILPKDAYSLAAQSIEEFAKKEAVRRQSVTESPTIMT